MFPLRDSVRAERTPVVTWILVTINVAVFLLVALLLPDARDQQAFAERFGLVPANALALAERPGLLLEAPWPALRDAILPFVTSLFLHGGFTHLLGNVWFLILFGDNVEDRFGRRRFLVFYVACGAVAALLHIGMVPADGVVVEQLRHDGFGFAHLERRHLAEIPMIGASGAIAGVLGAYLVLFPRARVLTLLPPFFFLEVPALLFLGGWFVLQFFSAQAATLMQGNAIGVAYWAHVGGFVAGVVAAFLLRRRRAAAIGARWRAG